MNIPRPEKISLNDEEQALLKRISFGQIDHDQYAEILPAAASLTRLLLERKAIPKVRRDYFTKPELNIGSIRSRMQIFERNGTRGEAIFEHAHFLPYLKYFIFGPHLPHNTIEGFRAILLDDLGTSGELMDSLHRYARAEARRLSLDRKATAEEFFKLALECDLDLFLARSIRDAVRSSR